MYGEPNCATVMRCLTSVLGFTAARIHNGLALGIRGSSNFLIAFVPGGLVGSTPELRKGREAPYVKQRRARLVLGWVTAWEYRVPETFQMLILSLLWVLSIMFMLY